MEKAFGRDARLRTRRELDFVRKNGRKYVGKYCVIIVADAPDLRKRSAVIISKRYSNRAVDRNRARRLFRETYRRLFPYLAPVWTVMIPRRYLMNAGLNDLLPEVTELCRQADILNSETR